MRYLAVAFLADIVELVTLAMVERSNISGLIKSATSLAAQLQCSGAAPPVRYGIWAILIARAHRIVTCSLAGEYCQRYRSAEYSDTIRSPTLVANLWDVTDRDIDKFAQSVFDKIALNAEQVRDWRGRETTGRTSVVTALGQSRDSCKLKYLTGAAPVIYGIPFYL